ncbi:MAG: alpha/beta hydrolase [Clostridia bacterium]|jgi:pimeloyl-ACP methyl ester carboxylesterase|nr:alpha/beta hydrolase [Clostridia bacterium]
MTNKNIKKPINKSFIRRVVRMMLTIFAISLACVFILVGVLLVRSSGKPEPFLDEKGRPLAGSISEKIYVNINGMEQGMFIKGKDKTKPVLLFLHGGPGMPEYAVGRRYPMVLENNFTVCWWEQRGAGLSYNSDIPLETMTFEQLISDTIEVTNYLRKRFGQEKIYLMAHSGGAFIGIQAAAKAPELYHAYIAMAQITNQLESEKLAYKYMFEQFARNENKRMFHKIEKYTIDEMNTPSYYALRDEMMHKLGIGTTHHMKSVISGIFWPVMLHDEYTLSEKINIWRGKFFNTKTANLWSELVVTDLTNKVQKLDIPVYFFHGIYDYTVSYTLAKDYFNKLQAPLKGFYTFEQSAHSPLFEEPEKIQRIIREDVLTGVNNQTDLK